MHVLGSARLACRLGAHHHPQFIKQNEENKIRARLSQFSEAAGTTHAQWLASLFLCFSIPQTKPKPHHRKDTHTHEPKDENSHSSENGSAGRAHTQGTATHQLNDTTETNPNNDRKIEKRAWHFVSTERVPATGRTRSQLVFYTLASVHLASGAGLAYSGVRTERLLAFFQVHLLQL